MLCHIQVISVTFFDIFLGKKICKNYSWQDIFLFIVKKYTVKTVFNYFEYRACLCTRADTDVYESPVALVKIAHANQRPEIFQNCLLELNYKKVKGFTSCITLSLLHKVHSLGNSFPKPDTYSMKINYTHISSLYVYYSTSLFLLK